MSETTKEETNRQQGRVRNRLTSRLLSCVAALALISGHASSQAHAQKKKPAARANKTNTASKTNAKAVAATPKKSPAVAAARSILLKTEPKAVVWLDEVRRGVTDEAGRLEIARVAPGRHTLRVRAAGFAERTLTLLPTERGALTLALTRTMDEAELLFQQAEDARERAASEDARREAAELYGRALRLRPRFAAAHVGRARPLGFE